LNTVSTWPGSSFALRSSFAAAKSWRSDSDSSRIRRALEAGVAPCVGGRGGEWQAGMHAPVDEEGREPVAKVEAALFMAKTARG
jgi:hypothetical protein